MKKLLILLYLLPSLLIAQPYKIPRVYYSECYRDYVPHGWLIYCSVRGGHSVTFYPDEKHEWKL